MNLAFQHRSHDSGRPGSLLVAGFWSASMVLACANQVTWQVDMSVQRAIGNFDPTRGDTVVVSGDFSAPDWTTTSTLTPSGSDSNLYTGTFANDVTVGDYGHHKFVLNPGGDSAPDGLRWESGDNRWFQVDAVDQTLPVVFFDDVTNSSAPPTNTPSGFLAGADMSHVHFFEDRGITYRVDGQPRDVFDILKERGVNCVRLRLFTSSAAQAAADPYNYTNNLDYTLPLALRVKAAGLKFLLDFHYSDTWADPGKQIKPDAWSGLNLSQLEQQIRDYSSNVVATLAAAGAMPDYVQVGNEIVNGLLWDDGRVGGGFENPGQWQDFGLLMKAAINGIRAAAAETPPQIVVHIDRGGDWDRTRNFFDNLEQEGVPYDIIGQSFYAWWHGDLDDLRFCLSNTAIRYGKPVVVMETAFPWTDASGYDPDLEIPKSPAGQADYTVALAEIVKGLPYGLGAGIVWWGSEYVQLDGYGLAGFHDTSFFDHEGNVLPVVESLGQLTSEVALSVDRQSETIVLQWPLSGAGMSLVTTTSPAPAALWTNVTNPVTNVSGAYRVTLPTGPSPRQLYRLEQGLTP